MQQSPDEQGSSHSASRILDLLGWGGVTLGRSSFREFLRCRTWILPPNFEKEALTQNWPRDSGYKTLVL